MDCESVMKHAKTYARILEISEKAFIVLYHVLEHGELTYDDLINLTNFSQASISRYVKSLRKKRYVSVRAKYDDKPGHPAYIVFINRFNVEAIRDKLQEIVNDILRLREIIDRCLT